MGGAGPTLFPLSGSALPGRREKSETKELGLIKDFVRTARKAVLVWYPGKHQASPPQAENCFPRPLAGAAYSAEPGRKLQLLKEH